MIEVARLRVLNLHKQEVIDNFESDKLVPVFSLDDGTLTFILKGLTPSNEGPVFELTHHLLDKHVPFDLTMTGDMPMAWFARITPQADHYEYGKAQELASLPSWNNQEHLWRLHQMNRLLDG